MVVLLILLTLMIEIFLPPSNNASIISTDLSCFNATPSDCKWYRDCLESSFKCENSYDNDLQSTAFAFKYGEKECFFYDQYYLEFSNNGKKWVNFFKKC
jgi:hypothetical protein